MFTTLPLELFVCREVIEQYFFENEPFHMQRHVFFTTVILFSAMTRTPPPPLSSHLLTTRQCPSSPATSA